MSPQQTLLLLRLLGAALLLAFLGVIAWIIYRDMQLSARLLAERQRPYGRLRVVASETGQPEPDTLFPLMPVTSIGRSSGNTIVLVDDYTSGEHALLILRGSQWWLEDLGSRNGTLLNDVVVTGAVVVTAGDVIAIGGTYLKIEF